MALKITAIRLEGGDQHQHITRIWWTNRRGGFTLSDSREQVISWIESHGIEAFVQDDDSAEVAVVTPPEGRKYLQACAGGEWSDNLLALPRK